MKTHTKTFETEKEAIEYKRKIIDNYYDVIILIRKK